MSRTTRVNGNTVKILDSQQGTTRETNARRVAARLERHDTAVDRVAPAPRNKVNVWLSGTDRHDDGCRRFDVPEGWRVVYTDVVSSGAVCVTLRPDE